jgi:hypothetical protein
MLAPAPPLRLAWHWGIVRRCVRSAGTAVPPAPPVSVLDGFSFAQSLWRFFGGIYHVMVPPSAVFAHAAFCAVSVYPQTVLAPVPPSLPSALLLLA